MDILERERFLICKALGLSLSSFGDCLRFITICYLTNLCLVPTLQYFGCFSSEWKFDAYLLLVCIPSIKYTLPYAVGRLRHNLNRRFTC